MSLCESVDRRLSNKQYVSKTIRVKAKVSGVKQRQKQQQHKLKLYFTLKPDREIKAKSVGFRSHRC